MKQSPALPKWLYPLTVVSIWGSLYIITGIVLKQIPALLLLFIRLFVASVILWLVGRRHFVPVPKKDYPAFLLVGFLGYYLANATIFLGIQAASGSFASLMNSLNPILITLMAMVFLRERITPRELVAVVLSVAGAAIVIGLPAERPPLAGVLLCFFSILCWAYATTHLKRLTDRYPPLQVTTIGLGLAAVFCAPTAALWIALTGESVNFSVGLILPIAYICIISTAFTYYLWNLAMKRFGASYCAAFYPVQPVVSVVMGVLLLHEQVTLPFLAGMALILVGMVLHNLPAKQK